jgi:uncharacterized spore protein YtfJ
MENFNELLAKLTEFLKAEVKTETIIGDAFQLGAFTCVPVMAVGLGLGTGGGEGKGNSKTTGQGEGTGAGGGAGIGMGPVGFLVANGTEIQFIPTHSSKGLSVLFEKAPDILEKYFEKSKDKEPVHA